MYTPQKCDYKYQLVNKKKKKFADIKKSCIFALAKEALNIMRK